MKVSDLLNPLSEMSIEDHPSEVTKDIKFNRFGRPIGKPRNRFTAYEDDVIVQGMAQKLTWGQIARLLPNRKRATCFNRYRTLQGIRKSRQGVSTASRASHSPSFSPHSATLSPVSPTESLFNEPINGRLLNDNTRPRRDVVNTNLEEEIDHYQLIHRPSIFSYSSL